MLACAIFFVGAMSGARYAGFFSISACSLVGRTYGYLFFDCISHWPGVARRPVTFLEPSRKVTKRSRPLVRRSFGLPCAARPVGRLRNSPSQARAQTVLADCPRQGCAARRLSRGSENQASAKPSGPFHCVGGVPCETPSNANESGGVGEDCLSPCRAAARASSAAARFVE